MSLFPRDPPWLCLREHWVSGKQNTQFPMGPVIKSFAIPPKFKNGTNSEKIICLFDPGWQINFLHFKVQDLITCKSKVPVVVCLGSWWVLTHDMCDTFSFNQKMYLGWEVQQDIFNFLAVFSGPYLCCWSLSCSFVPCLLFWWAVTIAQLSVCCWRRGWAHFSCCELDVLAIISASSLSKTIFEQFTNEFIVWFLLVCQCI